MDLTFGLEPGLAFAFWLTLLGVAHMCTAPCATYIVMRQGYAMEDVVRRLYIIWMIPFVGSFYLGVMACWKRRKDGR